VRSIEEYVTRATKVLRVLQHCHFHRFYCSHELSTRCSISEGSHLLSPMCTTSDVESAAFTSGAGDSVLGIH
jgi:hypothetical protein